MPDSPFVDQDGRKRPFSSFKGAPVALTFIYTKCPIPDFCPLMDRNFAAAQTLIEDDPALVNAHLVSVIGAEVGRGSYRDGASLAISHSIELQSTTAWS